MTPWSIVSYACCAKTLFERCLQRKSPCRPATRNSGITTNTPNVRCGLIHVTWVRIYNLYGSTSHASCRKIYDFMRRFTALLGVSAKTALQRTPDIAKCGSFLYPPTPSGGEGGGCSAPSYPLSGVRHCTLFSTRCRSFTFAMLVVHRQLQTYR